MDNWNSYRIWNFPKRFRTIYWFWVYLSSFSLIYLLLLWKDHSESYVLSHNEYSYDVSKMQLLSIDILHLTALELPIKQIRSKRSSKVQSVYTIASGSFYKTEVAAMLLSRQQNRISSIYKAELLYNRVQESDN